MAQPDPNLNPRRVSPMADEINAQLRRPGGVSTGADSINEQFRQARAARTAAGAPPASPPPATPPAATTPGPARPSALRTAGRFAGGAAVALPIALHAASVGANGGDTADVLSTAAADYGAVKGSGAGWQAAKTRGAGLGGKIVGAARGGLATAGALQGAYDSFRDLDSGYANEYYKNMGLDSNSSLAALTAADTGRVFENVGNAVTFGYAEKLGNAIGSTLAGDGFSNGWNQESARDRFNRARQEREAAAQNQPAPDKPQVITMDNGQNRMPDSAFQYSPRPDGIYHTKDANGNSVYSSDPKGLRDALAQANANRTGGFAFGEAGSGSGGSAGGNGQVDGGRNYANQLTRRGNQGAVIKNPHGPKIEDQLRGLLTSMKGSPSMRKAAADAILGEQQNEFTAHQAALNRNDAAESDMMNAQAKANESYADRRLKADSFNQNIGLRRHALAQQQAQNDAENTLKAYELTMGGLTQRGGKAAEDPDAKFYDSVYKSALEATDDPRAAAAYASRVMTDGGNDPGGSAAGRVGLTAERDAFANAREAYNSRWTTSSNPDFDTSTANLARRNWSERWLSRLPGGKDPTDLKWVDANGNEDWTGREAIGDEAPETYAQRRARNLELQRHSKGTN